MTITILVPPILVGKRATERVAGCTYTLYPVPNIYELYTAALLEKNGFTVKYVESVLNKWSADDFIKFLQEDASDAYLTWTVNLGMVNDLKAHALIRSVKKGVPIIFTGPGPSYFIDKFLLDVNTYVVRGEPELTTLDLLKTLSSRGDLSKVASLSYKNGDKIINNPVRPLIENLDELPFPARHLIDRDKYHNPKLKDSPYTAVLTSRNCPYRCIYCVPCSLSFAREIEYRRAHDNQKPPIRMRSVANVVAELELLKSEGYRSVSFQDDLFIINEQRAIELCQALKRLGFKWGCQSRSDKLSERVVAAMADSGCQYIDIGVESFDQKILDYIRKDIKLEDSINGIKLIKKYGILAKINVLFGTSPLETKETIQKTYKIIKDLDVDQVMFSIVSPFPGTDFYEMAKQNHWFVNNDYQPFDVQKKAITNFPNLSNKELEHAVFVGNLKFFLNPRFVFKHLVRFRSLADFRTACVALYRKLFA
jgi:radical SAM superfamily enzyme YgiQ (UPF0313 family)